jgi:hypothetical protein
MSSFSAFIFSIQDPKSKKKRIFHKKYFSHSISYQGLSILNCISQVWSDGSDQPSITLIGTGNVN